MDYYNENNNNTLFRLEEIHKGLPYSLELAMRFGLLGAYPIQLYNMTNFHTFEIAFLHPDCYLN